MIPELNKSEEMYLEHMTRYFFACQFVKGKVVLDIACGSGYGADLLAKAEAKKVIGVDISEEAINYCREKYPDKKLEFLVGSVEKIPLADKSVDIVVSFETIEHVNEKVQEKFLDEARRVLKKNGKFIISTPNTLVYSYQTHRSPFHKKELTPEEFSKVLKNRFRYVNTYYQDNTESSFVLSESDLVKEAIFKDNNNMGLRKLNSLNFSDSMYLVAVASDAKGVEAKKYVTLFDKKPREIYGAYERTLQQKNQEIVNLSGALREKNENINNLNNILWQKEEEIKFMKSSKFWKLREKYTSLKDKLKNKILKHRE